MYFPFGLYHEGGDKTKKPTEYIELIEELEARYRAIDGPYTLNKWRCTLLVVLSPVFGATSIKVRSRLSIYFVIPHGF